MARCWSVNSIICLSWKSDSMETIINIHIEKLPEGFYLATSDDLQGRVAQGRTVSKTISSGRHPEWVFLAKLMQKRKICGVTIRKTSFIEFNRISLNYKMFNYWTIDFTFLKFLPSYFRLSNISFALIRYFSSTWKGKQPTAVSRARRPWSSSHTGWPLSSTVTGSIVWSKGGLLRKRPQSRSSNKPAN